jgi:RNA polymerase sigma factor (sigma-70 family)
MKKNSRDWNKVLKNLDKEFPEPVMNEVVQLEYEPDVSLTDIEVADAEIDVAAMLNSLNKPRLRVVIEKRYLSNLTIKEVAAHFDVSTQRICQLQREALRLIRQATYRKKSLDMAL